MSDGWTSPSLTVTTTTTTNNDISSTSSPSIMFQIPSFQPPPKQQPQQNTKTISSQQLPTTIQPISNHLPSIDQFDYMFDIRSYSSYLKNHLINSINIKLPTTLLKRKSLNLSNILELINLPTACKQRLLQSDDDDNNKPISILFYDDDSNDHDLNINLYQILLKFYLFNNDRFNLYYMGFKHTTIPSQLMESSELKCSTDKDTLGPASTQTSSKSGYSSTGSSAAGFSIDDRFLNSIKKNSIDDNHKHSYNLNSFDLHTFPTWLKFISESSKEAVIDQLMGKFKKLEQSERLRIKSLLVNSPSIINNNHDNEICTPNTLCPNCDEINYKLPFGSIENGLKNRYNNIWPYEHSRVKINKTVSLEEEPVEDDHDDYFNANFINCNHILNTENNNYIATQNPLHNTIKDFWKIIHDSKIKIIISLDSGSTNKYLSSSQQSDTIIHSSADYIVRKLEGDIYHFQILNWPDFNVPIDLNSVISLIEFKNNILANSSSDSAPILVHCSAGCGRTGVFIAIDTLINKYLQSPTSFFTGFEENQDLIYKLINYERTQRISMVQNFQQYLVCYELILKYLKNHEQSN
ncbi:protein-tyrosine phosphatase-like protein [Scheffersomyces coipomensis]|uniref:protein-tyrosine phosphatase-like protein n=1 Tax=Scheffersomyces coipomensis TaxID=1788519 RepID=UPI00315D5392